MLHFLRFQHEVDICRKENPYVIPTKCTDSYGSSPETQQMLDSVVMSATDIQIDSPNVTGKVLSSFRC